MKAKIIIEVSDNLIGGVTSTVPLDEVVVIDGDCDSMEKTDLRVIERAGEKLDYYVYMPGYTHSIKEVANVLKQVYKDKPKLAETKPVEIYLLVTGVQVGKDTPPLYGDILAVFWDLDEAEKIAEKVKKGEPVDFIDTSVLIEYDELAIVPFTIR